MSLVTLRDLYIAELYDLYEAEHQVLRELPLLAARATSDELREAFDRHYRRTLHHPDRLEGLFRDLDERPRPATCGALRTVIEDARAKKAHLEPGPALDAALVAFAKRITHFEIAAYQSARACAVSLAHRAGASVLQETLDDEGAMDRRLLDLTITPRGNPSLVLTAAWKS